MPNPFRAEVVAATPEPQKVIYVALHNDYSESFSPDTTLSEQRCGEIAVKRLLEGGRGHFGCLEHPSLSILLQVDHNTMAQLRTHRLGSFDVQSMRYTGERIEQVARGEIPPEQVFYCRPPGKYRDRKGQAYEWTEQHVKNFLQTCVVGAQSYLGMRAWGCSEEHARGILPTSYFQNMMITGNARSWLHMLDVRLKANAQDEARWAMELVSDLVAAWIPEIHAWWDKNRRGKALLAP